MSNSREPRPEADLSRHLPAWMASAAWRSCWSRPIGSTSGPTYDRFPGRVLFRVLHYGDVGVDLFFVLSGFLITGILYDAKGKEGYFRNFYARRGLRIFPLYYGFLFATLVLAPALFGTPAAYSPRPRPTRPGSGSTGRICSIGIRGEWCLGSFDHFWSLSIEEQFYLFWPLVIFFCFAPAGHVHQPVCTWPFPPSAESFGSGSAATDPRWKHSLSSDSTASHWGLSGSGRARAERNQAPRSLGSRGGRPLCRRRARDLAVVASAAVRHSPVSPGVLLLPRCWCWPSRHVRRPGGERFGAPGRFASSANTAMRCTSSNSR